MNRQVLRMAVSFKSRRSKKSPQDSRPTSLPIRVLTLSAVGEMGGAERSLLEVTGAMPKERIALQVVAPPESPLAKLLQNAGIRVHGLALGRVRRTLNPLA